MIRKIKVWDVVSPNDGWGRNYAHIEYLFTGLKQTFSTKIDVEFWTGVFEDSTDQFWADVAKVQDEINASVIAPDNLVEDHYYDTWDNKTGGAEV